MSKLEVYVDMDGVQADCVARLKEIYPGFKETLSRNDVSAKMWEEINEKYGRAFFRELPEMPDFNDLLIGLDSTVGIDGWVVLSALPNPKRGMTFNALAGKQDWIVNHVGSQPCIFCLRSHKKSYATPNSVLIDDSVDNINEWVKAGGIGILHKNAKASIEELKSIVDSRGRQKS